MIQKAGNNYAQCLSPGEPMPNDQEPLIEVELDGSRITLLGTAHVSRASADKVKELLATGAYDAVAVELCPSRYNAIIDPDTLAKNPEGRKVKGVIHWVSASQGICAEVRLYDRLFTHPTPDADKEGGDYQDFLNPESLLTLTHCYLEPSLDEATPGERFQFEREGYFCVDPDHCHDRPIFNRTVTLRDSWAKIEQKSD